MGLNKANIKQRFAMAINSYDQQASVQQQINQQLISLLQNYGKLIFKRMLEIGCGTGHLSQLLAQHCQISHWDLNDLCDTAQILQQRLKRPIQFYCGDAEQLQFKGQYDLIASASTVQWFQQPEQFIYRCANILQPKGILLFSTFSSDNLTEIRQLTGIGLSYPTLTQWQQWLSSKFHLLAIKEQSIQLNFNQPMEVLRHLRETGVTGIQPYYWTKKRLSEFCQNYQHNYSNLSGQLPLTYTPLLFLAEKKEI